MNHSEPRSPPLPIAASTDGSNSSTKLSSQLQQIAAQTAQSTSNGGFIYPSFQPSAAFSASSNSLAQLPRSHPSHPLVDSAPSPAIASQNSSLSSAIAAGASIAAKVMSTLSNAVSSIFGTDKPSDAPAAAPPLKAPEVAANAGRRKGGAAPAGPPQPIEILESDSDSDDAATALVHNLAADAQSVDQTVFAPGWKYDVPAALKGRTLDEYSQMYCNPSSFKFNGQTVVKFSEASSIEIQHGSSKFEILVDNNGALSQLFLPYDCMRSVQLYRSPTERSVALVFKCTDSVKVFCSQMGLLPLADFNHLQFDVKSDYSGAMDSSNTVSDLDAARFDTWSAKLHECYGNVLKTIQQLTRAPRFNPVPLNQVSRSSSSSSSASAVASISSRLRRGASAGVTLGIDDARPLFTFPRNGLRDAVTVTAGDLVRLERNEYLNDNLIDFYIKHAIIKHSATTSAASRFFVFSSFFYRRLTTKQPGASARASLSLAQYQSVQRWTKNVDIFALDYIFIPVNQHLHWTLVVICHPGLVWLDYLAKERQKKLSDTAAKTLETEWLPYAEATDSASSRPAAAAVAQQGRQTRNSISSFPSAAPLVSASSSSLQQRSLSDLCSELSDRAWSKGQPVPGIIYLDSLRVDGPPRNNFESADTKRIFENINWYDLVPSVFLVM